MSYNAATLFDEASPNGDEYLLLDDLVTLVALGLLEERPTPERARVRTHRVGTRGTCVRRRVRMSSGRYSTSSLTNRSAV